MCLKPKHAKFQRSSAKQTFLNLKLNGGVKYAFFKRKTSHILKTVRDRAKVTINH